MIWTKPDDVMMPAKLNPGDLKELYDAWRRYFPLGSPGNVSVRVR